MQIDIGIIPLILLFGAAQGVFMAIALAIHRRGNRTANRVLAFLLLVFSIAIAATVAYWTRTLLILPHLFAATAAFGFLYGPLFYLYTKTFLNPGRAIRVTDGLHFIPALLHFLYMMPLYGLSAKTKVAILSNIYNVGFQVDANYLLVAGIQIFHLSLYIVQVYRLLTAFTRTGQRRNQSLNNIFLSWLKKLGVGFCAFLGLWLAYCTTMYFGIPYYLEMDYFVNFSMAAIIYAIGYFALLQPEVLSTDMLKQNGPKYEKSTLTPARANAYLERLQQVMEVERPFVNPDLRMQDLAELLTISPHHLSQIINEHLDQNFSEFINGYRIEAAKKKLVDPNEQHFTILSIAYEVGFNNKASFNTAFKKQTGITPSQYRNATKPVSSKK